MRAFLAVVVLAAAAGAVASCGGRVGAGASDDPDAGPDGGAQAGWAGAAGGAGAGAGAGAGGAGGAGGKDAGKIDAGTPDGAAGGADAGPPGVVVVSKGPQSWMEAETHVAVTPGGWVSVAWIGVETGYGASHIGAVFSKDGGKSFGPVEVVADPNGGFASDPAVAADAQGNVWLAFMGFFYDAQGQPSDAHVWVARAPAGQAAFDEPVEITDPKEQVKLYDKPWIAVTPKGQLIVGYARFEPNGVMIATSADGKAWTRTLVVPPPGFGNLVFPCSSKATGRVFVAYFDSATGPTLRWSDDDGATWPPANKTAAWPPSEGDPGFADPNCVAQGDDVWVSYGRSTDTPQKGQSQRLSKIRVAHSGNGGKTVDFRTDAQDDGVGPYFLHPQLALEEGSSPGALDVTYYAGKSSGDPAGTFRRTRSIDGGKTWTPSTTVQSKIYFTPARSSPRWLGDYTGLVWKSGTLFASWVDNSGAASHVAFGRFPLP